MKRSIQTDSFMNAERPSKRRASMEIGPLGEEKAQDTNKVEHYKNLFDGVIVNLDEKLNRVLAY